MGQARNWTEVETEYLKDKWGSISIGGIARKLNRTENAIIVKACRLKLGAFTEAGDYITFNQLCNALGMGSGGYKDISWINNKSFPIKYKLRRTTRIKVVYVDDFWKWADENRTMIDFSKVEENILGIEPEWVKKKRKSDFNKPKGIPWTSEEDARLAIYLKQFKYYYKDLAKIFNRSSGAIQRRICDLGLIERPLKAENHIKWTTEEYIKLGEYIKQGYSYNDLSLIFDRSEKAIRGRIYDMYLTENIDTVRKLIGNGTWGDNRPVRKVKHFNQMNADEKQSFKDNIRRLLEVIREAQSV